MTYNYLRPDAQLLTSEHQAMLDRWYRRLDNLVRSRMVRGDISKGTPTSYSVVFYPVDHEANIPQSYRTAYYNMRAVGYNSYDNGRLIFHVEDGQDDEVLSP